MSALRQVTGGCQQEPGTIPIIDRIGEIRLHNFKMMRGVNSGECRQQVRPELRPDNVIFSESLAINVGKVNNISIARIRIEKHIAINSRGNTFTENPFFRCF